MACPLLLLWCPPPATSSTVLLGTVALPNHPTTLCWWGWQSWSSPSMTPLLSNDFFFLIFPGLLFPFPLAFPAQMAWADLTPGTIPTRPRRGMGSPHGEGRLELKTLWIAPLRIDFLPRVMWRSWIGKSQWLRLCWSSHYLVGTNSTTTHKVSTFQTLKIQNSSVLTQGLCSVVLQGLNFFFDEADGSLCPPLCYILAPSSFYLWWDVLLSCEYSEIRFLFFFFLILPYPLRNITEETFFFSFLSKCSDFPIQKSYIIFLHPSV